MTLICGRVSNRTTAVNICTAIARGKKIREESLVASTKKEGFLWYLVTGHPLTNWNGRSKVENDHISK